MVIRNAPLVCCQSCPIAAIVSVHFRQLNLSPTVAIGVIGSVYDMGHTGVVWTSAGVERTSQALTLNEATGYLSSQPVS